jgi:hypothetical protein
MRPLAFILITLFLGVLSTNGADGYSLADLTPPYKIDKVELFLNIGDDYVITITDKGGRILECCYNGETSLFFQDLSGNRHNASIGSSEGLLLLKILRDWYFTHNDPNLNEESPGEDRKKYFDQLGIKHCIHDLERNDTRQQ